MQTRPFISHVAAFCPATLLIIALTYCTTSQAPSASLLAGKDDWKTILDATSTAGWRQVGPGELKLERGEFVTHDGMGLFTYTREKLSNCQIRVVFKLTGSNDNSGVFIRMPDLPKDAWDAVNRGYEVQIDNTGDSWHRTGCLYSFTHALALVEANVGDWNTMIITLYGPRTRVHVNSVLVTDFMEGQMVPKKQKWYEGERGPRPDAGYIGLQNHGDDTHVHFKEVSIRRLL